jgi:O-acetyl-ADP-ribose deacetylase (regulator of RNase III)
VGPVYSGTDADAQLLAAAHRNSLQVARELGARTVAFPAISTGAYGYPVALAAPIALREALAAEDLDVTFVLFDHASLEEFRRAARALGIALPDQGAPA